MIMRKLTLLAVVSSIALSAVSANAATVAIDLSGAVTGTTVTGVGATFAQGFAAGAPLTLSPSGTIDVAFFNPGVSPASNSLLSQPGNAAPIAMLLGGNLANAITFTAGSGDGGAFDVIGYDANGAVTGSTTFSGLSGYSIFNVSGIGNFAGLLFTNNSDPAGLRFMNFSYETVVGGPVPEPASWAMMILGFGMVGGAVRYRNARTRLAFA